MNKKTFATIYTAICIFAVCVIGCDQPKEEIWNEHLNSEKEKVLQRWPQATNVVPQEVGATFDLVMDHKKRRFYYLFRERSTVFTCIEGCTDKQ